MVLAVNRIFLSLALDSVFHLARLNQPGARLGRSPAAARESLNRFWKFALLILNFAHA